jgi:nucleotide-binding universal stress UspA family protein
MKLRNIHPIRKLLVPTDFSPESVNALYYAVALAGKLNSKVVVYHSVHFPLVDPHGIAAVKTQPELEAASRQKLEAIINEVTARTGFRQLEPVIDSGFAVDAIADNARELEADLIVMGTRGAHGISGALLGSNTMEVTEKSGCPVLSIPGGAVFHEPRKVLFATDYSDNDFQSIYLLTEFLKIFRTEIVVAHVEHDHNHKVELKLMEWFRKQVQQNIPYDHLTFDLLTGHSVESALEEHISRSAYDVVVTSMRRRNLFDRLTGRSLTRRLSHHVEVPLMVFHAFSSTGTPVF